MLLNTHRYTFLYHSRSVYYNRAYYINITCRFVDGQWTPIVEVSVYFLRIMPLMPNVCHIFQMNNVQEISRWIISIFIYIIWIKSPKLSAPVSKGGKSLLLNLCGRSRFIIPLIVWTTGCKYQNEIVTSIRHMFNAVTGTPEEDLNYDDEDLTQISITEIAILILFIIL